MTIPDSFINNPAFFAPSASAERIAQFRAELEAAAKKIQQAATDGVANQLNEAGTAAFGKLRDEARLLADTASALGSAVDSLLG